MASCCAFVASHHRSNYPQRHPPQVPEWTTIPLHRARLPRYARRRPVSEHDDPVPATDGSRFLPPEDRVRGRCRDVCTRMHPSSSDYESRAVGPHGEGANELARNPPKGGRSDDAATHPGKSAASIPLAPDSFPCQNDTRMAGPSALPPSPYLAIVRRGEGVLFLALDTCLAEPGMDVVWDRRLTERRRPLRSCPPTVAPGSGEVHRPPAGDGLVSSSSRLRGRRCDRAGTARADSRRGGRSARA